MRESPLTRRSVLKAAAVTAGTAALAGCTGDSDETDDGSDTTPEPEPTETEEPEATSTDTPAETDTDTGSDGGGDPGEVDREIYVESESFNFIPGSDEPIVVQQGETIELTATALDDGIGQGHGLAIPAFEVNLAPLFPDEEESTVFEADEAGEFEMICSIQCSQPGAGQGHQNMTGTFIVE